MLAYVGSCWGHVGSKWPQVGTKMAQVRFMLAQVGPKTPKLASKGLSSTPRWGQHGVLRTRLFPCNTRKHICKEANVPKKQCVSMSAKMMDNDIHAHVRSYMSGRLASPTRVLHMIYASTCCMVRTQCLSCIYHALNM